MLNHLRTEGRLLDQVRYWRGGSFEQHLSSRVCGGRRRANRLLLLLRRLDLSLSQLMELSHRCTEDGRTWSLASARHLLDYGLERRQRGGGPLRLLEALSKVVAVSVVSMTSAMSCVVLEFAHQTVVRFGWRLFVGLLVGYVRGLVDKGLLLLLARRLL